MVLRVRDLSTNEVEVNEVIANEELNFPEEIRDKITSITADGVLNTLSVKDDDGTVTLTGLKFSVGQTEDGSDLLLEIGVDPDSVTVEEEKNED